MAAKGVAKAVMRVRFFRLSTLAQFSIAAFVGGMMGLVLTTWWSGHDDTSSDQSTGPETRPHESSASSEVVDTEHDMDEFRDIPNSRRALWLAAKAEVAPLSEMPRLVRWMKGNAAGLKMLVARWIELDPQHLFKTLVSRKLGDPESETMMVMLLEDWAITDPEAVGNALASPDSLGASPGLRGIVTTCLMRCRPELGLRMMRDWGIHGHIPPMEAITLWAAESPRAAAELVAEVGSNNVAFNAMAKVGKGWGKKDPRAALEYAASMKGFLRKPLAENAMALWAAADLEAAVGFATEMDDPIFRSLLGSVLVAEWAKKDPAAALAWSQQHLAGQTRVDAIGRMFHTISKEDPKGTASLVAELDPGSARDWAIASVAANWTGSETESMDELMDWILDLPDEIAREHALQAMGGTLMHSDPNTAIRFINGERGHLAPDALVRDAAAHQVGENPQAAIEWASRLPESQARVAFDGLVYAWMRLQPGLAIEWVSGLPPSTRRSDAVRTILRSQLTHNPNALPKWVRGLPDADRDTIQTILKASGYSEQAIGRILGATLDGLP